MSVARLLASLAHHAPDEIVLSGATGSGDEWTAAAIRREIDTLTPLLADCRVLAVLADNCPAWVMADLAALEARIAQLPLPVFFTRAQMGHALAATGSDTLLTDQPQMAVLLSADFTQAAVWNGLTLFKRKVATVALPEGTAKISFTSGSTGNPKGVCLSFEGLADTAVAVAERLADLPVKQHLCVLPLALLLENVAGVYAPLLQGARIHLPPLAALGWQGMAGFAPAALQQSALATGANSVILVPELAKAWTVFLAMSGQHGPDSLCFAAVGGARVDPTLLAQGRGLGLPLYQGYGLTECGSVVCLNRPGDDGQGVGRPLGHAQLRIVEGEVIARTRAFLAYLGDDRRVTSADLRINDVATDEFSTGDCGHFDAAGHLHLDGRKKNLLITSFGRNIAPEWVEAALLAQPGILQAVVVGDARPALAALLVPAPGINATQLAAMVQTVNASLPDYARIGQWATVPAFTVANGLATGNGRPMRAAIHAHHATLINSLYAAKEPTDVVL
ncbi:MAG: AMP-binding protein [Rhodocyclaceae bacterium]|nr:AMP-binding protein [Rhodocyclaceae bacterium]